MNRLAGKVAVITGAAGGIGTAAAALFSREGAQLILVDIDRNALDKAAEALDYRRVRCVVADVTRPEDAKRYVEVASEAFGGIDVLVANAGIEGVMRPIEEYPLDVFHRVMAVNVTGVLLGLKYAIPPMRERGGGSIVITSSTAGLRGTPGISPYTASKHAVIGLMRTAALECAKWKIRVNTVNPAPIETRMMRSLEIMRSATRKDATTVESVKDALASRVPLGRYGTPDEVAALMLFLASDESRYCSGGTYMVDGGMSAGTL